MAPISSLQPSKKLMSRPAEVQKQGDQPDGEGHEDRCYQCTCQGACVLGPDPPAPVLKHHTQISNLSQSAAKSGCRKQSVTKD
jgi:hypothetical protein